MIASLTHELAAAKAGYAALEDQLEAVKRAHQTYVEVTNRNIGKLEAKVRELELLLEDDYVAEEDDYPSDIY